MALADRAELAVRLTLDDRNFTGGVRRAKGTLGALDKSFGNTQRALGRTGANLQRVGTIATVALGAGLLYAVKQAADFEAQLLTINTIARETTDGLGGAVDGLDRIGEGIRKLSTKTGTPLADLTQGYYDILSAGVAAADAQGVLDAANTLAIGGLATTAQTVDLLTTAINAYGQTAGQAAGDADLFAKAIELGKVTADEIAASFAAVAPVAAQQGIEIEEVAAAYAALTAQGVPAVEVATQMQRAIVELLDPSKDLRDLQDKLGVSFLQIAQDKGLVVALQAMRDAVGDDDEAFKALFGRIEGYKFALQTTGPQQEIYNRALEQMGESGGTAAAQAAERMKGLQKQLDILDANFQGIGVTIGAALLPKLTPLIQKLNDFLLGHQGDIAAFGDQLAGAFERVADAATKINWQGIKDGLSGIVGLARLVFDAFTSLPPIMQQLAIGAFAINKVTGGLVTGLVKDLGGLGLNKIFTGSFLERGSTAANPMWVQMAGGVPGVGGVAGGKSGGGLGLLGAVTIAGFALGAAEVIGTAIIEATGGPTGGRGRDIGGGIIVGRSQNPNDNGGLAPVGTETRNMGLKVRAGIDLTRDAILRVSTMERADIRAAALSTNAQLIADRMAVTAKLAAVQTAATYAGQQAAAAIRDKDMSVTLNNYNSVSVSVRDQQLRSRSASSYGFMIGGK